MWGSSVALAFCLPADERPVWDPGKVSFNSSLDSEVRYHCIVCVCSQCRGGCLCAAPYAFELLGIDLDRSTALEKELLVGDRNVSPFSFKLHCFHWHDVIQVYASEFMTLLLLNNDDWDSTHWQAYGCAGSAPGIRARVLSLPSASHSVRVSCDLRPVVGRQRPPLPPPVFRVPLLWRVETHLHWVSATVTPSPA